MSATPSANVSLPGYAIDLENRLETGQTLAIDRLWVDPGLVMRRAGMSPDRWQLDVLLSNAAYLLILCGRQMGKSTVIASLALITALIEYPADVLLFAPTMRQAMELMRKVKQFQAALAAPRPAQRFVPVPIRDLDADGDAILEVAALVKDNAQSIELANGSRILSLPGMEANVRGYSPTLIIIDEASRASDQLYRACRPMLAASKGRLVCLTTPFGKRGFFHEEWEKTKAGIGSWETFEANATECKRISRQFLEEERVSLGERWYRQEYECSFEAMTDAAFDFESIQRAFKPDRPADAPPRAF